VTDTSDTAARLSSLFYELYEGMPRGGPGDPSSTERALSMMPDLPPRPLVLELGCGPGRGVARLAALTRGRVCALDLHHPFVAAQVRHAAGEGRPSLVYGVCADMRALPFGPATFDLVWSEGALYSIGFTDALQVCAEVTTPGGYLAASEAVWTVGDPPAEIRRWWDAEYPAIAPIASKVADVAAAGFAVVGHFTLPPEAWRDNYCDPLRERLAALRRAWTDNGHALGLFAQFDVELATHDRFGHTYSYEFIVGRRRKA